MISKLKILLKVPLNIIPGENHRQTLSHNVVSSTHRHGRDSNSQL